MLHYRQRAVIFAGRGRFGCYSEPCFSALIPSSSTLLPDCLSRQSLTEFLADFSHWAGWSGVYNVELVKHFNHDIL